MKLKVLSYNIHKGFTMNNRSFILQQIRAALREVDADILFLQEVLGDHTFNKIPDWQTAIQFEYLAETMWPHVAYGKNAIYPDGHHGNAILSKFPILSWSNHVISNDRAEDRGLLLAEVCLPESGQKIVLANTHLGLSQLGRETQTTALIEHLKPRSNFPWILVGDFNDWNRRVSPRIEKELQAKEVFRATKGQYPKTFPALLPFLSLDRIFVHRLRPVAAHALRLKPWVRLSDHLPLYAEVEFEAPCPT